MIWGSWLTGTSTSRHTMARRCRRPARSPAAPCNLEGDPALRRQPQGKDAGPQISEATRSGIGPACWAHGRSSSSEKNGQILIVTFDLALCGVHNEDLVATLAESLVYGIAAMSLRFARYSSHRDPLAGQECGCCFFDGGHDVLSGRPAL